ncbi:MAG: chaperonin family protein RbcX [Spirulinaceae cyanobacterium]
MYPKKVAQETTKAIQNYLTFQAVKTIVEQLSETNPPQGIWLRQYSSGKLQDGEAYLEGLMLERKDLVLRIMTVRQELAEAVVDFLPGMLRQSIQESNLERRKQLLERLTQTSEQDTEPELDTNDSPD